MHNEELFSRAQRVIPGGVNSPVRAFKAVGGTPRFIARAQGAYMWDADGQRYIDYIGSWGPMILGHGHPAVVAAVQEAVGQGFSFGAPTEREVELAEAILALVPSMDMVRLVSSGTEAAMSAMRLARGATGRKKIIKFEGCYHGHADALLVIAGARLAPRAPPRPAPVHIGAHGGAGTMVDTWATVGSCAQIGKNVHLSGGVGIGGVLEPLQANPTIIEDNCFIGARSEVVEGVIVEEGSVISMGVFIGQSTRIYDRETGEIHYGRVPAGSVVVSGSLPSKCGKYSLYAAVIVKKVDAKTRAKVGINALLRSIDE